MHRFPRLIVSVVVAAVCCFLPGITSAQSSTVILQGFPLLKQQHSLTCEASAASMATRGQISEGRLMRVIPRRLNPNLGFRGNPNGEQGTKLVDYGVYAAPIQKALEHYDYHSTLLMYGSLDQIPVSIDHGWPVIAWITYKLQHTQPRLAWNGSTQFFLVPHEHAVLIVGYDDTGVIANDPWTRKRVRYPWVDFRRAWGYFGDMALSVEPCPMPASVSGLHVSLSSAGITWTWHPAAHASQYQIEVVRHGDSDQTVYRGKLAGHFLTVSPVEPGGTYEITIRALSPCGGISAPTNLWFQAPTELPTPPVTPSPIPSPTAPPIVTPAPEPTATPTAQS